MAQRRMSVIDVLEKLDDGGALEDLREAIAQVNHALAVAPTKSKGSVTLKINFSKISKSELHIVDEVTVKVPKNPWPSVPCLRRQAIARSPRRPLYGRLRHYIDRFLSELAGEGVK